MPDDHPQYTWFWGLGRHGPKMYFTRRCDRERRDQTYFMGMHYCPCSDFCRARYVCFDCRRMFKPNIRTDNMYSYCGQVTKLWTKELSRQSHSKSKQASRSRNLVEPNPHSSEPPLITDSRNQTDPDALNRLHCPECGKSGRRVGGSLEVPPRKKERAWEALRMSLESGAKFDNCGKATREAYLGVHMITKILGSEWEARTEEKRRRIEVLRRAVELGLGMSDQKTVQVGQTWVPRHDKTFFLPRCDRRWEYNCQYDYDYFRRTKWVCFHCRRMFKPILRPENEYYYSGQIRRKETRQECRRRDAGRKQAFRLSIPPGSNNQTPFDPNAPKQAHCPVCGEPGSRVGDTFEAPPQKQKSAWAQLCIRLEGGEEFQRYRKCPAGHDLITFSERKAREEEKARRIEVLRKAIKLGGRTTEEERRLCMIRARHGRSLAKDADLRTVTM
ncbi:hypothetical protein NM688_g971 [Phlebia brevispora]|uniref:Uncharacterized protein n=1 Tax=Phlebia brevispora TaxID=194682 RepID=A0ACC1TCM7_9APHY|nr:hypothetical protein NM688_g971 [Phlebia brevispora]